MRQMPLANHYTIRMRRLPPLRVLATGLLIATLAACAGNGGVRQDSPDAETVAQDDAALGVASPGAETADADTASLPAQSMPVDASDSDGDAMVGDPQPAGSDGAAPAVQPAPTQAELDYAAIYGQSPYNPVADPTLPAPAQLPTSYDPWEKLNRHVHAFNNVVDRTIAKPLANAYVAVVPRPVRLGVGNFFANLGQPITAINALLQGRPVDAAQAMGRFVLNFTVGVGGVFDPASKVHIPFNNEDFGQTLGVWGWKQSRYVELPLFGPRTVRDVFGLIGDAPLSPIRQVSDDPTRIFLQGLQLVDVRTQLFAVDSMREGATDEYALFRDAWLQRRRYQISGDSKQQDDSLPEYLRDDTGNPSVPADAMPIIPGSGG